MFDQSKFNDTIDTLIRLGLLIVLVGTAFIILAPFIIPIIWGVIIAVGAFPLFKRTVFVLGKRKTLTAVIFTFIGLMIIVVPSIFLAESTIKGYQFVSDAFRNNNLTIPAPSDEVMKWPLIGNELYSSWLLASENLEGFFSKYASQFQEIGGWLIETTTGFSITVLQFILSIIIGGVLLAKANLGEDTTFKVARRLVGERAQEFVKLTTGTIRSVVQGVLGIAVIQAIVSAVLLMIFDIPFAGLWALAILVLAIMQLPPFLILGPMIIFAFSELETFPAIVFTVFALLISVSDSLLKPVFLGRGVEIPMLVVLLGAIGGMLAFGILGLFVGAVILALGYKLLIAWLNALDQ